MTKRIRIGLPKGKVHGNSKRIIEKSFNFTVPEEKLHVRVDDYDVFFLKHRDIAELVSEGDLDFGVTSEEWLNELRSDVNILKKLDWCDTKMALIVKDEFKEILTCVTEFYNIASNYFKTKGMDHVVIKRISGSSEALVPTMYDSSIDCVETGDTLNANELFIKEVLFDSSMVIICNKSINNELINKFNIDIDV